MVWILDQNEQLLTNGQIKYRIEYRDTRTWGIVVEQISGGEGERCTFLGRYSSQESATEAFKMITRAILRADPTSEYIVMPKDGEDNEHSEE